jgi:hypothetical protein
MTWKLRLKVDLLQTVKSYHALGPILKYKGLYPSQLKFVFTK